MSEPLHVLIVEDSMEVVDRIVEIMRETLRPLIVAIANNVEHACKIIDLEKPDTLILDIQLGEGENGIDLLKAVRRHCKNITIIMFTNFYGADLQQKCIDMGADYFLDKTMDFDKLPGILKELKDSEFK